MNSLEKQFKSETEIIKPVDLRIERDRNNPDVYTISFNANTDKQASVYSSAINELAPEFNWLLDHASMSLLDDNQLGYHSWVIIGDVNLSQIKNIKNKIHELARQKDPLEIAFN